jgi:hypothetical protein
MSIRPNDDLYDAGNGQGVKASKRHVVLPIGRTARLAFQINEMRTLCCEAAAQLAKEDPINEQELEECARLEDSLAAAQRILKSTVSRIIISRLKRRSRLD